MSKSVWVGAKMTGGINNRYNGAFPGSSVVKNMPASARDMGSIPDLGKSHMLQNN